MLKIGVVVDDSIDDEAAVYLFGIGFVEVLAASSDPNPVVVVSAQASFVESLQASWKPPFGVVKVSYAQLIAESDILMQVGSGREAIAARFFKRLRPKKQICRVG